MEPDWLMLPDDLLSEIALKLDSVEELIYFSVVCRSWHRLYGMVKKEWTTKVMPWLMLPESKKDNPDYLRKIYSPSKQTSYLFKLPETFDRQCSGSSCGWLFTLGDDLECHLFNPLTRVRLPLPSQSTMPIKPEPNPNRPKWWIRYFHVSKVLTFYDDNNNDFIVLAIYDMKGGYITYARPHDQVWTPIITQIPALLKKKKKIITSCKVPAIDAVRWGSQILILYHNGAIGSCDMSALQNSQPITISEFAPPPLGILDELRKSGTYKLYLVESFGDLLMVLRYIDISLELDDYYESIHFEIFKLKFDTKTWEMLEDLGDVALFVGGNCSMSVNASCTEKCKRNCIYFGDDEKLNLTATKNFGGHDMGCYHMETEKVEKVYKGDDIRTQYCGAFWFMPKF